MLLSPYLAASTLLVASTLAAPHSSGSKRSDDCGCVTEDDAWDVAWVFQDLIQRYSADLATSALTEDFQDWSSSVSTLINQGAALPQNLTAPTFSSRAEFMKGQGGQPQIPFDILNVFWGCDHVAVRWQTTRPALGQPTEAASLVSLSALFCSTVLIKTARYWKRYPGR